MTAVVLDHNPLEIDPRDCELCGHTIDQHECIDLGEGPEHFCLPDDDLVKLWELADSRDRWRQDGSAPPPEAVRNSIQEWPPKRPYRTPQSTVDAFNYLCREGDTARLAEWMKRHPADTPFLLKTLNRGK
jgi:hypothetical protein